ncbi:MAG: hypothetical protein LQ344_005813 [Seirophora lacunosa]|nr:MAG: hypothetical protein LQ344_005813 [Seirophora lacunosa]
MVSKKGTALKGLTTLLRTIELLGSILILGITSYWLAILARRSDPIPTWMKAVEGMAGGAVIYTAFAVLLTCFLGGKTFFAFLAVLFDLLFVAAFVAIAVLTRNGTHSCPAENAPSPIGPDNRVSCRLETVVFAVAIILAVLLLISAGLQILLSRQHKKEKRFGPGPSNDYTSGSGKKQPFWKRKRGTQTAPAAHDMDTYGNNGTTATTKKQPFWKRNRNNTHDAELAGAGAGAGALITEEKHRHQNKNRMSHETGVTGTTAGSPGATYGGPNSRYGNETAAGGVGMANSTGTYQPYQQAAGTSQPPTQQLHDPAPYAEVHHGGYPHAAGRNEGPTTFGHGNYQAA